MAKIIKNSGKNGQFLLFFSTLGPSFSRSWQLWAEIFWPVILHMKTYCWSKNKIFLLGNDGEIMIFCKISSFVIFRLWAGLARFSRLGWKILKRFLHGFVAFSSGYKMSITRLETVVYLLKKVGQSEKWSKILNFLGLSLVHVFQSRLSPERLVLKHFYGDFWNQRRILSRIG